MAKPRILFISQEIAPYIPSTTASNIGRLLPTSMQSKGYEVRTFMPKFGAVNERRNQLHEVIRLSGANIVINDNDHPLVIKVASMQPSRIQVYFIDNEDYFQKNDDDAEHSGANREDNDERAIFFARGAMETAKKLRWDPTIIQCSGWITSLVPLYLKKFYGDDPSFKSTKIIYFISPGASPESINEKIFTKLKADGFNQRDIKKITAEPNDPNFLHKIAIDNSTAVIIYEGDNTEAIVNYAKETNKPYMVVSKDSDIDVEKFTEFYKSL